MRSARSATRSISLATPLLRWLSCVLALPRPCRIVAGSMSWRMCRERVLTPLCGRCRSASPPAIPAAAAATARVGPLARSATCTIAAPVSRNRPVILWWFAPLRPADDLRSDADFLADVVSRLDARAVFCFAAAESRVDPAVLRDVAPVAWLFPPVFGGVFWAVLEPRPLLDAVPDAFAPEAGRARLPVALP